MQDYLPIGLFILPPMFVRRMIGIGGAPTPVPVRLQVAETVEPFPGKTVFSVNTDTFLELDRLSGEWRAVSHTVRLAEANIEPSVGGVGDSYDNALAETVIGLFEAEVIHCRGPWRSFEAVEFSTLEWANWFNQPPSPRADRQHPAGRSRGRILRSA